MDDDSADNASNAWLCRASSTKVRVVVELAVVAVGASHTRTMRSGSGKGSGLNSTRVDQAEHGGVGADTERQHAHRHQRERRRADQRRQAVARVADRVLDPAGAAVVAMALFHLRDAAEGPSGLDPGLVRSEPARHAVALGQLQVRRHFVVELAIEAVLTPQRQQPLEPATERHALASRMRATSAVACSQCATSFCSWVAPVRVRE